MKKKHDEKMLITLKSIEKSRKLSDEADDNYTSRVE